jgi:LAS superfamily LD-carboxypeptidase LdcB
VTARKYPVRPIKLPADLKGVKPGELPETLLRPIEGKGKLHHLAADAYEAMDEAANADGIDLSPTSQADTYRSLAVQEYGFFQRHTLTPKPKEAKQKPRIYKGKAWYLKRGMAPMAVPGTSNHNLGIAIDIANASGKRLEWLLANEHKFGFSHELDSEPWHIRYTEGDDVPQAVKEWKAKKTATQSSEPTSCRECGRPF